MKKIVTYTIIATIAIGLVSCNKQEKTNPVRKNIDEAVFGSGYIEQMDEYVVSASVNGVINFLPVKEGDMVGVNDVIAIIESEVQDKQLMDAYATYNDAQKNAGNNSPQLSQLQAQILQAREQFNLDQTNYNRYKDLRTKNSVSQLELDRAELQYTTSKENLNVLEKRYKETKDALQLNADRSRIQVGAQTAMLNDYRLTADKQGEIIEVYKKRGELVRPGEAIVKMGSGAYQIKLFVSEDDIAKVDVGQKVAVHLNTYPDEIFNATVSKILPGFNDKEQSYVVEATFDKLPSKMFSGTQLQANIQTAKRDNVLVIPTSYVVKERFVTLNSGVQKQIEIGSHNTEWTEVISGISENDVITRKKNKTK